MILLLQAAPLQHLFISHQLDAQVWNSTLDSVNGALKPALAPMQWVLDVHSNQVCNVGHLITCI